MRRIKIYEILGEICVFYTKVIVLVAFIGLIKKCFDDPKDNEGGVHMDRVICEQQIRASRLRAGVYSAAREKYGDQYSVLESFKKELEEYYYKQLEVHKSSIMNAHLKLSGSWKGIRKNDYETTLNDNISLVVFPEHNDIITSMQEDITLKMCELSEKFDECEDKIQEEARYRLDRIFEYGKSGGK